MLVRFCIVDHGEGKFTSRRFVRISIEYERDGVMEKMRRRPWQPPKWTSLGATDRSLAVMAFRLAC